MYDGAACLFCFHHAGGSAVVFRDWIQWSKTIQVYPVELPGKGTRQNERMDCDIPELINQITKQILAAAKDKQIYLYGHSMGAALAFYTGVELAKHQPIEKLIVSGRQAPHCPSIDKYHSSMDDEKLIEELRRLNGTPVEILNNAAVLKYILPMIKADYALSESFTYHNEIGTFPIVGYCGDQDDVTYKMMLHWAEVSNQDCRIFEKAGNHFFPFDLGEEFWRTIEIEVSKGEKCNYEYSSEL